MQASGLRIPRATGFFIATLLVLASACASSPPPKCAGPPPPPPIVVPDLSPLVTRAGLRWLVVAQPKQLFANDAFARGSALVVDEPGWASLSRRHGIDLRTVDGFAMGGYESSTLFLVKAKISPVAIEGAFSTRVPVQARSVDRHGDAPARIVRASGQGTDSVEALGIFGTAAAGLERGDDRHLRAAERGVLGHPVLPLLEAGPLQTAREILGEAPLCVYVPAPLESDGSPALGRLLYASEGVALCVRPTAAAVPSTLTVEIFLAGDFSRDEERARSLLQHAITRLRESDLGRLCLEFDGEPEIVVQARGMRLRARVGTDALFSGLRAATGGTLREILKK